MINFLLKKTLKSTLKETNSCSLKNDAKILYYIDENYFRLYKAFRRR